jgi:FixJ family two-component response regulator
MSERPTVFVVDHDPATRDAVRDLAGEMDLDCKTYASGFEFLDNFERDRHGCLVMEVRILDVSGPQIQRRLAAEGVKIPIIFLAAETSVPAVVRVMREGAVHFFEKPFDTQELWEAMQSAIWMDRNRREEEERRKAVEWRLSSLSSKEREVFAMVLEGKPNKEIARIQDVSVRTVESRRSHVMEKLGVGSLVELVRIGAGLNGQLGAPRVDAPQAAVYG